MTLWEWLRQRYLRRKHIIDAIGELEKKVNPYKIADLIVYDDLVPCWNEPIDQYWETAGKPIGERTMNEVYAITQTPKNGDTRPKEKPTETFINGSWYNTLNLKNLSLQKKLGNFES